MSLKRVLLLGSGRTCPPLVELLTRDGLANVTIASDDLRQAETLANSYPNTSATSLNVQTEEDKLKSLIKGHDLVMSLVPYTFHPLIATHCIEARVNMVTSSYVSPQLEALHESAQSAGITIMNECGLDPGIDHFLAMECIDDVHKNRGKVFSFESWCGGLPHSLFANNPLKYKFSWSPSGVLIAALNPAQYLKDGQVVEIPGGGNLMKQATSMSCNFSLSLPLEGYPNRNSLQYKELYGIREAKTVIRGTLRYKGYCKAMTSLIELGLLNNEPEPRLDSNSSNINWSNLLAMLISRTDVRQSDLSSSVLELLGGDKEKYQIIKDLGLLSTEPVQLAGTPLKALAAHLEDKYELGSEEYDTVLLEHKIGIERADMSKEEHSITLHMDGDKNGGDTAMSKLVGKTAAIAAKLILTGVYKEKGVLRPLTEDFYKPALKLLQEEGVHYNIQTTQL